MNEDDIYRASTQYRLWSFTPEALATLRKDTNATAAERVKAALNRVREARSADGSADTTENEKDGAETTQNGLLNTHLKREVECLTVEEEQKLVGFYASKALELGDHFKFPVNVKATAVQYLKRFYLSNSPMTYHPKSIMPAALFLASKTENHYTPLKSFAEQIPKATPEDIIAPEFIITQGLRFTFDVRHPHRGAWGGLMELQALANGSSILYVKKENRHFQSELSKLGDVDGRFLPHTATVLLERIGLAQKKWKEILDSAALLSDAYFLYTPAQIWLAAFMLVDQELCKFYLRTKFPTRNPDDPPDPLHVKVLKTLEECGKLLKSHGSTSSLDELKRIDKKLYKCRNPDKIDLIGLNKARKRDGAEEGIVDENVVKRRKLEREREQRAGDDLFGPEIQTNGKGQALQELG